MAKIWLSPTGNVVRGHVLDCSVGPLEARLKEYDPQLYVRWNAKKLRGWGLWEVRRRPEFKQIKHSVGFNGNTYSVVDYVEQDLVNHIMDVPYLNYKILDKIKEIDTWSESYKAKDFVKNLEYKEAKRQEEIDEQVHKEREYNLKQIRPLMKDLMEYVRFGGDPSRIADVWDKV